MKKFSPALVKFLLTAILLVQAGSPALAESPKIQKQSYQTLVGEDRYNKTDSDASILRDVVKQMAPAITNFLTTYSFTKIQAAESSLESKYASKRLNISWDVSTDAKMFVVVLLSGKKYCYQVKGEYSATLVKSSRCS